MRFVEVTLALPATLASPFLAGFYRPASPATLAVTFLHLTDLFTPNAIGPVF